VRSGDVVLADPDPAGLPYKLVGDRPAFALFVRALVGQEVPVFAPLLEFLLSSAITLFLATDDNIPGWLLRLAPACLNIRASPRLQGIRNAHIASCEAVPERFTPRLRSRH
jgi:hypothetical protein